MRIQYCSDLHIELYEKSTYDETLIPKADYLVLCGDISTLDSPNLRQFLEYVSDRWKRIFYIPGNSEIWNYSNIEQVGLYKLKELCSPYTNIKVLYKETYLLKEQSEELLIVGLPLWHKPRDQSMLHYHSNIYIKPIPAPVDETIFKKAHEENVKFLQNIIKNAQYPLLICSYYSPFTWTYEEDWLQEPSSAIIDRECEELITYPILSWIVGHNHYPIQYTRRYYTTTGYQGSVLFVSNPRGKPNQNIYYRTDTVLNLKPTLLDGFEKSEEEQLPTWVMLNSR
jgi:hypothetical protein